jgi:AcrR family transcriptional regulator
MALTLKRTFDRSEDDKHFERANPLSWASDPMSDQKTTSDTRERILDVAERLFMENGYEATSMRTITGAAEVNLAAVNYHFGSKEALLREVFRRRLAWLNQQRLQALDRLERTGRRCAAQAVADSRSLFRNPVAHGRRPGAGRHDLPAPARPHLTEPAEFIRTFFAGEYAQVIDRYKLALFRALPDVPKAEIVWRLHFMLGAMSYAIAGTDVLQVVTGCEVGDLAGEGATPIPATPLLARRLAQRLMPFLLGGLRAPLPQFHELPLPVTTTDTRARAVPQDGLRP